MVCSCSTFVSIASQSGFNEEYAQYHGRVQWRCSTGISCSRYLLGHDTAFYRDPTDFSDAPFAIASEWVVRHYIIAWTCSPSAFALHGTNRINHTQMIQRLENDYDIFKVDRFLHLTNLMYKKPHLMFHNPLTCNWMEIIQEICRRVHVSFACSTAWCRKTCRRASSLENIYLLERQRSEQASTMFFRSS